MFGALFGKECKQILKSLVYYFYILVLALFLSTQLKNPDWIEEIEGPKPNQEHYGMKETHDKNVIMGHTLASLTEEIGRESFSTYPYGFYKGVAPTKDELATMKKIIESCTGKSWDRITFRWLSSSEKYRTTDMSSSIMASENYQVKPREDLTYADFQKNMERVTKIIGKGSYYEKESYESGATVPMSYEEALKEYETMRKHDRVTGAYMRLFCDYAGIMLAFLPMFLGVTRCLRDQRAVAMQVIHAKSVSSAKIILSRYLANVFMAFLPVVLIGFILQLPYCYYAHTLGFQPDYFAFLTYPIVWLLPEIMVVMSLAFLITEMTDKIFVVFIQIFWMLAEEFTTVSLAGHFGMRLALRWNTIGATQDYLAQRQDLYWNRSIYTVIAVLLIAFCVVIYEKKRKEGESLYAKIFKNRH